MSEITWIKLVTNVYTNKKINQIRKMKNGDSFFTVWIILLCIAGDANADGEVVIAQDVPYTDEMLASEMREPLEIVNEALAIFERFKMIVRTDGVIKLANWEKYQSVDKLAEIRESNRIAQQRRREKLRDKVNDTSMTSQASDNDKSYDCHVTESDTSYDSHMTVIEKSRDVSSDCHAENSDCHDTDKDIDIDTDIEVDIDADAEGEGDAEGGGTETVPASAACPYAKIKEMYHLLCPSFPTIKNIEGKRRQAVAARWREFPSLDTFAELFRAAEASDYLKRNVKTWARFDWLMTPTYFPRVLEHMYDDDYSTQQTQTQPQERPKPKQTEPGKLTLGEDSSFDIDELFTMSVKRSYGGIDPRETGITYGDNAGGAQ